MRSPSAIYPFSSQLLPIVNKFNELQSVYSLKAILSPPGLGIIGHDAGYICNKRNTNIIISGEEEIDASNWNTLHVFRTPVGMLLESSYLLKIMERAVNRGKSVIYYDFEMRCISQEILELQNRFKDKFSIRAENSNIYDNFNSSEGFLKITAPVILVGGLVECSDILGVLICLNNKFINIGSNPAVVTKQPFGQLFGFHNINHIFRSPNLTESLKIRELNRYLAAIEHYDCPDVFIVEAPDAVMRFSDIDPNGFGILTYMLAQAIRPDMFVCCFPVELAVSKFIESLSRDFRIRLGTPIQAVQVSNIVIDSADLNQSKQLSYVHVDQNRVQAQIKKESSSSQIPIFDIDSGDEEKLFQCIDYYMKSNY
jgi:peptide maturation system protein (TIGR04066 family)